MTRERLSEVMQRIKGERAQQCHLLIPDSSASELSAIETALGVTLPPILFTVLNAWREQGSEALLTRLPQVLNPLATPMELDPTGQSMRVVFPSFCAMLDNTESLGIVLDSIKYRENPNELLLIGIGKHLIPNEREPVSNFWASFFPKTLVDLAQWEVNSGIKLSPQMRQMFLRVNGSIYPAPPYFVPVEWLQIGLLADLYQDFWSEVNSDEPFERIEAFIGIHENGTGDEQGFFLDTLPQDGEYTIYDWNHETAKFTVAASDFASWIERILIQGW